MKSIIHTTNLRKCRKLDGEERFLHLRKRFASRAFGKHTIRGGLNSAKTVRLLQSPGYGANRSKLFKSEPPAVADKKAPQPCHPTVFETSRSRHRTTHAWKNRFREIRPHSFFFYRLVVVLISAPKPKVLFTYETDTRDLPKIQYYLNTRYRAVPYREQHVL